MAEHAETIHERLAALPRLLTLQQAAEELGVKVWTLRRAIWDGELPQVRLGKSIRIDRKDLEAWLGRLKVRGPVL
jgi:excisionase family DNA binding protein